LLRSAQGRAYQSNASFHPLPVPLFSVPLLPWVTTAMAGSCLPSGNRMVLKISCPSWCSCRLDCMVRPPRIFEIRYRRQRSGVYIAVFSLSMWAMYRDGKRFSGVRWVVAVTCVPCLFSCCSTNPRRITLFSFVAVTLSLVSTIVYVPMDIFEGGTYTALVYFCYTATAWYRYVLSASIQNVP
jgi:hypothetical protein